MCAACWGQLRFIQAPQCRTCGLPFEVKLPEDAECGECMKEAPPYGKMRAALRYDEGSQLLIGAFKYHDKTLLTPLLVRWMQPAAKALLKEADVLVPVPIHWRRMLLRRFNQSALLAFELAKVSRVPVLVDGLLRVKYTPPQASLSGRNARLENVRGVFAPNAKRLSELTGKRVLLIDDVHTTGATIEACVKALKKGGAAQVNVLTLARRM